ncbi:hypothetical protein ACFFX0_17675 [Citricoccus parietis]|uniref:Uncharacterized protein n=1 Tax=Citricoccus parietis TaxID=592307 RepID=A0ABV5G1W8_9MICC
MHCNHGHGEQPGQEHPTQDHLVRPPPWDEAHHGEGCRERRREGGNTPDGRP